MTVDEIVKMEHNGSFLEEYCQAFYHQLSDQEQYDLSCYAQAVDREGLALVSGVAHVFKMGMIAGIRQERQRRKA